MKIPKRTDYLAEYLAKNITSSKSTIAPTLLKGPEGCGKSWITAILFQFLEKENSIIPVKIPYQLSGKNLVSNIISEIEIHEQEFIKNGTPLGEIRKKKIVLFVERIDQLFNLTGKEKQTHLPKVAKGRGASQLTQTQHAAELRSYLIERRDRVSLIATSEPDTRFMDDPDLPFFNFFTVIDVKPLSPDESRDFLISKISDSPKSQHTFRTLESFAVHASDILTEGLISYVNLLASAILEVSEFSKKQKSESKLIESTLAVYFNTISPAMESKILGLSYAEKSLMDRAIRLPYQFRVRDLKITSTNESKVILNLRQKGFLSPASPNSNLYYKISSSVFRAWLRYKVLKNTDEVFK
ncbi:MAG: hypothetical protein ACK5P5_02075 [Pseudobdellovibrionaceae bacterium]|jgi:hypothetical protein